MAKRSPSNSKQRRVKLKRRRSTSSSSNRSRKTKPKKTGKCKANTVTAKTKARVQQSESPPRSRKNRASLRPRSQDRPESRACKSNLPKGRRSSSRASVRSSSCGRHAKRRHDSRPRCPSKDASRNETRGRPSKPLRRSKTRSVCRRMGQRLRTTTSKASNGKDQDKPRKHTKKIRSRSKSKQSREQTKKMRSRSKSKNSRVTSKPHVSQKLDKKSAQHSKAKHAQTTADISSSRSSSTSSDKIRDTKTKTASGTATHKGCSAPPVATSHHDRAKSPRKSKNEAIQDSEPHVGSSALKQKEAMLKQQLLAAQTGVDTKTRSTSNEKKRKRAKSRDAGKDGLQDVPSELHRAPEITRDASKAATDLPSHGGAGKTESHCSTDSKTIEAHVVVQNSGSVAKQQSVKTVQHSNANSVADFYRMQSGNADTSSAHTVGKEASANSSASCTKLRAQDLAAKYIAQTEGAVANQQPSQHVQAPPWNYPCAPHLWSAHAPGADPNWRPQHAHAFGAIPHAPTAFNQYQQQVHHVQSAIPAAPSVPHAWAHVVSSANGIAPPGCWDANAPRNVHGAAAHVPAAFYGHTAQAAAQSTLWNPNSRQEHGPIAQAPAAFSKDQQTIQHTQTATWPMSSDPHAWSGTQAKAFAAAPLSSWDQGKRPKLESGISSNTYNRSPQEMQGSEKATRPVEVPPPAETSYSVVVPPPAEATCPVVVPPPAKATSPVEGPPPAKATCPVAVPPPKATCPVAVPPPAHKADSVAQESTKLPQADSSSQQNTTFSQWNWSEWYTDSARQFSASEVSTVASPMATVGAAGRGSGRGAVLGRCVGNTALTPDRCVKISKELSFVLRHQAVKLGIHIRPDGYCRVEDVLSVGALQRTGCSLEDLQAVVHSNEKQRFELTHEEGHLLIRATQGHSMKAVQDESLLRRLLPTDVDLPEVCVHGTYARHLESIASLGLIAGGLAGRNSPHGSRNHIHFVPFVPGDNRVISGMRFNCEVALFVDLHAALQDGIPFYVSTNKVLLSPGLGGVVPAKYIKDQKWLK